VNGSELLRVPKRFGRYLYVKTLGTGSSSAVILVRHLVSSSLFACKIVSRSQLVSANVFGRFEQEVRLLPSLTHPNIVHFEEILFSPEFIFVVMEYCSQGDLFSHIVANGLFPESRAREILRHIGGAVQYIHDRDIVHRDLKPENILLDRHFNAKLADFGFCHVAASKSLLRTPCGSPFYAPPEIVCNRDYDGKSADIWSLGILLFTMVTGTLPWSSDNQAELFRQIKECEIVMPGTLSPALREWLTKMLDREPAKRLTIGEVLSSQWCPKQQGVVRKTCIRSASWEFGRGGGNVEEESVGEAAVAGGGVGGGGGGGTRKLLVRPRNKVAARLTMPAISPPHLVIPSARKSSALAAETWI
jgi:carbon catabolite-derepressing protein kinase